MAAQVLQLNDGVFLMMAQQEKARAVNVKSSASFEILKQLDLAVCHEQGEA